MVANLKLLICRWAWVVCCKTPGRVSITESCPNLWSLALNCPKDQLEMIPIFCANETHNHKNKIEAKTSKPSFSIYIYIYTYHYLYIPHDWWEHFFTLPFGTPRRISWPVKFYWAEFRHPTVWNPQLFIVKYLVWKYAIKHDMFLRTLHGYYFGVQQCANVTLSIAWRLTSNLTINYH